MSQVAVNLPGVSVCEGRHVLEDVHVAVLARPRVDVLKEVGVNGTHMSRVVRSSDVGLPVEELLRAGGGIDVLQTRQDASIALAVKIA